MGVSPVSRGPRVHLGALPEQTQAVTFAAPPDLPAVRSMTAVQWAATQSIAAGAGSLLSLPTVVTSIRNWVSSNRRLKEIEGIYQTASLVKKGQLDREIQELKHTVFESKRDLPGAAIDVATGLIKITEAVEIGQGSLTPALQQSLATASNTLGTVSCALSLLVGIYETSKGSYDAVKEAKNLKAIDTQQKILQAINEEGNEKLNVLKSNNLISKNELPSITSLKTSKDNPEIKKILDLEEIRIQKIRVESNKKYAKSVIRAVSGALLTVGAVIGIALLFCGPQAVIGLMVASIAISIIVWLGSSIATRVTTKKFKKQELKTFEDQEKHIKALEEKLFQKKIEEKTLPKKNEWKEYEVVTKSPNQMLDDELDQIAQSVIHTLKTTTNVFTVTKALEALNISYRPEKDKEEETVPGKELTKDKVKDSLIHHFQILFLEVPDPEKP